ncbi:N-acetyl-gamma-glutamyl-phosphate reductase [Acetobacteraceae bacterium EV16G]|uniref:N-acetyl-gamma-glutamyl-phosphate reductase n=1 Tax=Sorlinia euscelidii TaxID=3081148 RepID=A0ABU7TYU3_9PROT
MPRIFIDGEAGTTGLDIKARLKAQNIALISIDPAQRKDPKARLEKMISADLVVLCLPDDAAREAVNMLAGYPEIRVLDASSAHRVAPDWVYGFPEIAASQARHIAQASRVSNPGCYPTGAIALLRPLVDAGLLPSDIRLTINAVSGYSGGGHRVIEQHARDGGPAFALYELELEHKHVPEIMRHAGLSHRPVFVPSVGHFARGMIVSIPLHLDQLGAITSEDLRQCLRAAYRQSRFIRVADDPSGRLTADALAGEDILELRVHGNDARRHAVLTARLDNLGKGASGAALQNIRLMLGKAAV